MPDLLQTGQVWLAQQLKSHVSRSVTYRRGIDEVTLQATLGESEFPRESTEGLTTEDRTQDFLILASDLVLSAVTVTPEPGDQIELTGMGTFEVTSPGGSEPAWRYSGPHRLMLRIHSREV